MKEKYEISNKKLIIIEPTLDVNLESDLETEKKCLFYENKKLMNESYYYKNLLHGPSTFYSKDGNVLSKTWFFKGKRFGIGKKYYLSTKLYAEESYKEDHFEGKQIYYYEDGTIRTIMNYENGRYHGEVKLFYENSKLKRHLVFEHGKKLHDNIFDINENLVDEKSFTL